MSTFLTVALLAVFTTVGLVGAVASDGAAALVWAVGTVVVAGVLARRLRSAPPGLGLVAAFVTGILVVSAGLPAAILLTETGGRGAPVLGSDKGEVDPSAELRRALAKAGELLPGGADSILSIDIDGYSTQVYVLNLAKGQRIYANYSQSSDEWHEPSSTSTNDRIDAAFPAAELANLDLTAARKNVDDSARGLGVDLSKRSSSDGVVIARRSADKKLVATYDLTSRVKFETDRAGNLPDNLALAKVDGLLPTAERLLRAHGVDPTKPVLDELKYRVFAENASTVGSADPGTVDIRLSGAGGRGGTLKETVGRFPEVRLYASSGTNSRAFPLTTITADGIEKARADLERRSSVPPIDAHAISLEVEGDTTSPGWMRGGLPPLLRLGLGPDSDDQAYFRPDGTFVKAAP